MTRSDPSADSHADHDALLIAAFVAGDLDGLEADVARALVAQCRECADLANDLVAMTSALRTLPPLVRTRDFRITAEQAAAVDRRGIRRFLPTPRPGLGFARPLGSSLAALGVAGLLFTSLLGSHPVMILSSVGSAIGGAAGAPDYAATFAPEPARTSATDNESKAAPSAPGASAASSAAAVPNAAPSPAAMPSAAASAAAAAGDVGSPAPLASGQREVQSSPGSKAPDLGPSTSSPQSTSGAIAPGMAPTPAGGIPVLPAASIAVLLAGLGLLGADVIARRR